MRYTADKKHRDLSSQIKINENNDAHSSFRRSYSDEIDMCIKQELRLPTLKSIDPVSYVSKIFRESFKPSIESFKEYALSGNDTDIEKRNFCRKFSHISFERGLLSSAVLKGQGRVMLIAAFRHALGYKSPANAKEQRLFESNLSDSNARHIKILHNDWIKSACAIVADAAKGASKAVAAIKTAIDEWPFEGNDSGGAFGDIMPFVSVKKEQALLNSYKKRLKELKLERMSLNSNTVKTVEIQIRVLEDAISKIQGIINKKNQLRIRFLTMLEYAWLRLREFQEELERTPFRISRLLPFASLLGTEEEVEMEEIDEEETELSSTRSTEAADETGDRTAASTLSAILSGLLGVTESREIRSEAMDESGTDTNAGDRQESTAVAKDEADAASDTGSGSESIAETKGETGADANTGGRQENTAEVKEEADTGTNTGGGSENTTETKDEAGETGNNADKGEQS